MIGGKKFIILLKLRKIMLLYLCRYFSTEKCCAVQQSNHGSKYRPGFRRIYHSGVNIWENILVPAQNCRKNIRQIGERDEVVRLYVEDYVNTYLKQVYPSGGPGLRVGLLLGNSDPQQEVPCLFVDGALEMEEVVPSGEKIVFSEAAWKKAYQRMEETFPKKTVQGWFICGAPGCMLSPLPTGAAQAVFRWEKPAYVHKQRRGR